MAADTAGPATKPFWLDGNFAPVMEEVTETQLEVTGAIPPELNGRYFRNTANPHSGDSPDWFFGDGMIHGVELQNGKANWYRNRYVKTPLLDFDEWSREAGMPKENSLANTHILAHAGKILALQELHPPYEMTKDLETVGMYTYDGKLPNNMTAHPKICPDTGEMMAFAYFMAPPFLTYLRVSKDGEMAQVEPIQTKAPTMAHDFIITRNYTIFMDLPMVWDMANIMTSATPIKFDESYGARIGIMPRHGTNADVKWFEIDPCYVYHTMNAFEDGDEIHMDVCRMVGYTSLGMENPPVPNLHRWTANMKTGAVSERQLDDAPVDFPRISDARVGTPYRYGYTCEFSTGGVPLNIAFHKYDWATGARSSHRLGEGRYGGEAVFVPAEGASAEDDGYLMAYVYDSAENKSELVILDASDIAKDPVARIHLPVRVPYGFHGSWIPDAA